MLGNIYNYIDLDFKGLWKLQMDIAHIQKWLVFIEVIFNLFMLHGWLKKGSRSLFCKKQISNFDVQYKSRSCNKTLCVNLIPVYEHDFACTLEIKAYIKALLPFIKF